MIVDMHCHTAGLGAGHSGCFVSRPLRRNPRFPLYLRAFGVTRRELFAEGDGVVVRKLAERLGESREVVGAVVLALDAVVDENGEEDWGATEISVPDDFLARETAKYANLHLGASIHPGRRDALERLDRARAQGAVLLKWLPPIQRIDPANPALVPFYEKLVELDLPLLVHTGSEHSFTQAEDALGDPHRLRLPLAIGTKVIAAHAAASGRTGRRRNMERLFDLVADHPNLYADISSLTQANHPGALERLLKRTDIADRLLYGTDMPLVNTAIVSPWFFVARLGWTGANRIQGIRNPWDRDVALKRALGVPEPVFHRSAQVLGLSAAA